MNGGVKKGQGRRRGGRREEKGGRGREKRGNGGKIRKKKGNPLCVENRPTNFCLTGERANERRGERENILSSLRRVVSLVCALLSLLALCWAMQAQAQDQSQRERAREREERRGETNASDNLSDVTLQKRVDSLQAQIERLSKDVGDLGRIQKQGSAPNSAPNSVQDSDQNSDDVLQSAGWLSFIAEMQERLRVMERTLTDLTGRIEQLERYGIGNTGASGKRESNAGGESGADKRSADERFSRAQNLLRQRKVEEAARAFGDFAKNYPNDPRVSEALFYLGESYAVLQDDKAAMKTFLEGYKKDRNGSFAPRLLLRLGQMLAKLKKGEQACRVLREFQKRFGDKDADMTKLVESELVANSCSGS